MYSLQSANAGTEKQRLVKYRGDRFSLENAHIRRQEVQQGVQERRRDARRQAQAKRRSRAATSSTSPDPPDDDDDISSQMASMAVQVKDSEGDIKLDDKEL